MSRADDILQFIVDHTAQRGFPPTLREIANEFGVSSTNGIRWHLAILVAQGRIQRTKRTPRGIRVMKQE